MGTGQTFAAPLLTMALVLGGCGDEPCITKTGTVEDGDTIRVTIIEPWNRESQYPWSLQFTEPPSCDPSPDLSPGSTFVIHAKSMEENGPAGCLVARGKPKDLEGVTFLEPGETGGYSRIGSPFLDVKWRVQIGERCTGVWTLGFGRYGDGHPLTEPVPGQLPTSNVMRTFYPDDPSDCGTTETNWACAYVVKLERID